MTQREQIKATSFVENNDNYESVISGTKRCKIYRENGRWMLRISYLEQIRMRNIIKRAQMNTQIQQLVCIKLKSIDRKNMNETYCWAKKKCDNKCFEVEIKR